MRQANSPIYNIYKAIFAENIFIATRKMLSESKYFRNYYNSHCLAKNLIIGCYFILMPAILSREIVYKYYCREIQTEPYYAL